MAKMYTEEEVLARDKERFVDLIKDNAQLADKCMRDEAEIRRDERTKVAREILNYFDQNIATKNDGYIEFHKFCEGIIARER